MLKPFISRLLLISGACLLFSTTALAGKEDFKLPIKVDSKSQFVDGKRKTSVFKEDVQVRQGSLSIDADEVRVSAENGKGKEIFIAIGKPAVYSQTMDDGSKITAKAGEIRYEVESRTLELNGSAELHQDTSMVRGEKISFNLEKEQLIAGGDESDGRVTTVFQTDDKN
ncbi:lipopolysaccharide transport periplasmic protein LptA [Planctobacterium marinum]|uniref:lipopolysaccharide transport periplasmic protein LptA n=1 Tax=Planctobacterium marinum TaxID=1631968 RepID=UPI0030C775DD